MNPRLSGRRGELPPYCFAGRRRPLLGAGLRRVAVASVAIVVAGIAAVLVTGPQRSPTRAAPTRPPQPHPHRKPPLRPATPVAVPVATTQRLRLLHLATPFYCGRTSTREVAITFDDGPGPRTRAILSQLRAAGVRATFFEIGANALRRPRLARAETRAGEVGDHTLDHLDLDKLPLAGARHEILAGRAAILGATGVRPVLFRPPYEDADRTTERLIRQAGLLEVLWSVDSRDWQNGSVRQLRQRVLAELHPGGIVLLHEQARHTLPTLRWLLGELKRRRLRPVTVSQLLAGAPPTTPQLLADRRGRACVQFPYRGK